jgi:hypothetical protein
MKITINKASLAVLFVIVSLSSCTSQKAWIKRGESKGWLQTKSDTLIIKDTIQGWRYDTTVQFLWVHDIDTLITSNGKDSVVTIVKWKERTIRQIKTEKDTIVESKIITNEIPILKIIKPNFWQRLWWLWIILTFILTIWLVKYLREDYNVNKEL